MANYAIRVELKGNPTFDQYETLHALMANFGFYQTVNGYQDSDGSFRNFELPHAMYYGAHNSDITQVRNLIVAAIQSQIQRSIVVFVVLSSNWSISIS
jgi:hypothetical protein